MLLFHLTMCQSLHTITNIPYHPSVTLLHECNYAQLKNSKSGRGTYFGCKPSSHDWRHEYSQSKQLPHPLFSKLFNHGNCTHASERNIALGRYCTVKQTGKIKLVNGGRLSLISSIHFSRLSTCVSLKVVCAVIIRDVILIIETTKHTVCTLLYNRMGHIIKIHITGTTPTI